MRALVGLLLVLVVLAAGATGALWLWPSGGGVQLVYTVQFPPGFSGDREAVARETADVLQKRLSAVGTSSGATAYRDGRVVLRIANVDEKLVPALRPGLEMPGRLRVRYAKRPVELEAGWVSRMSVDLPWRVMIELPPGVTVPIDDLEVLFDGKEISRPTSVPSAPGGVYTFQVPVSEIEARLWSTALTSGPLPYPVGAPQVETYRGRSLRP